MVLCPFTQHEAAVAIGAFDEILVAHLQIDARMAKRSVTSIATDAGIVNLDDFGRFDGHETALENSGGS
jgi:hypothetical protein